MKVISPTFKELPMNPRLPRVTAETVAERIDRRPETITLAKAQAIYHRLAEEVSLGVGRRTRLGGWLNDLVLFIQGLIDTPAPNGLVTSARMLKDADDLTELAQEARSDIAVLYDRFHASTKAATEALEIITAWSLLQEAADDALLCNPAAA
jgi:hypothetical protein